MTGQHVANMLTVLLVSVAQSSRNRPIAAVHKPVKMLRSQPAFRSFAANANLGLRRTHTSRDVADISYHVFADAASVRICGMSNAAMQRMSPNRPFAGIKLAPPETVLSP